jgi:hypothetical protein
MVKDNAANSRLVKAALLERAIAGLIIDGFLPDEHKPISNYLMESTREQVHILLKDLY